MRGRGRALRTLVMPQGTVLLIASLLLFNAFNPDTTAWALAHNGAYELIVPARAYAAPRISAVTKLKSPQTEEVRHVNCTVRHCIVLSFDDGPNPLTTPKVLDVLESRHVTASFFVVGSKIEGNGSLLRRMAADSMEIGNHSWSHGDMRTLTPAQIKDELTRTQAAVVKAGVPHPTLFRPPYGAINDDVVQSAGLQTALWNEDPRDWQATEAAALAQQIVANAHPDGVIDLHDIHQVTVDALPAVIDQLRAEGYQFVTVSVLLHSRERVGHAPFYGYAAPTSVAR